MRLVLRTFLPGWLVVAGVMPAPPASAQVIINTGQAPPRDRVAPPRVGTAVLKGRVVDGVSSAAVPRARVRLQGTVPRPPVLTDTNGGFVFSDLPAGGYTIATEKSTYLSATYPDRGRTIRAVVRPVMMSDGETQTVRVPIYHGGAIAGRVMDASGDPVEFAQVAALRLPSSGRTGKLSHVNGTQTNDLGEFRLARLEPGSYLIQVIFRRNTNDDAGADKQPVLPQPLPTFYPNAAAPEQAEAIVVERGQTVSGIDVMLVEGTPTVVTGTIVGTDGQPITNGGPVSMRRISTSMRGFSDGAGTGVRPDGTFRLEVAPGEYQFEARANAPPSTIRDGPVISGIAPGPQNDRVAFMKFTAAGDGLDLGAIAVDVGATVSGRFVFDGTSPRPDPKQSHLMLFTPDTNCRVPQAQIDAEWQFRLEGMHGTCVGAQSAMLGRWMLKAMMHNGVNLLDSRTSFEPGQQLRNVEVIFTDRRSELTFTVADDRAQPTREYVAIIFSPDKSLWSDSSGVVHTFAPAPLEALAMMRATGPVGTNGPGRPTMPAAPPRESISAMRPGDYLVVAIDDIAYDDTRDPAVLERLATVATRVTIADATNVDVPLRRFKLADVLKER